MTDSEKLDLILDMVNSFDAKIESLDSRIEILDAKSESLDSKIESLDARMNGLDARIDIVDTGIDGINDGIGGLDTKADSVEQHLIEMRQAIGQTHTTLENEIHAGLKQIAKELPDLSKNMQETAKPNTELELLAIKVRLLEADVRELKEKLL